MRRILPFGQLTVSSSIPPRSRIRENNNHNEILFPPFNLALVCFINHLDMLPPAQDEAVLRDAGFSEPTLFYTGITFRGWVAYA